MWKTYLEPLKTRGVRLGSPAPSSAPSGKIWLQQFLDACAGGCTVDFIALRTTPCIPWRSVSVSDYSNQTGTTSMQPSSNRTSLISILPSNVRFGLRNGHVRISTTRVHNAQSPILSHSSTRLKTSWTRRSGLRDMPGLGPWKIYKVSTRCGKYMNHCCYCWCFESRQTQWWTKTVKSIVLEGSILVRCLLSQEEVLLLFQLVLASSRRYLRYGLRWQLSWCWWSKEFKQRYPPCSWLNPFIIGFAIYWLEEW